jgi:hypothetical protein
MEAGSPPARHTQGATSSTTAAAMLVRLRLLAGSVTGGLLLLVVLCLGGQNLNDRPQLRLGFGRSAPLPSGFLVGLALVVGVISGGAATALLMPGADQDPGRE